jgi:hypothetical protein
LQDCCDYDNGDNSVRPFLHIAFFLGALLGVAEGASTFTEDFSSPPAARGWRTFGDTNLFQWDSGAQQIHVTWDSSKSNSYFYHLLGTTCTWSDDFSFRFDLKLDDIVSSNAFEVCVGLINLDNAFAGNFFRGTGRDSPNLVEFAYFPAFDSFSPTISQVVASTNSAFLYNHDNLLELTAGAWFHIEMVYSATNHHLTTTTFQDGSQFAPSQVIIVPAGRDFRVGAISISSYSDQKADGSILAHGAVDNIAFTVPDPPVSGLTGHIVGTQYQVQFLSVIKWVYLLERSVDLNSWSELPGSTTGNGSIVQLTDPARPAGPAFYRVKARRS